MALRYWQINCFRNPCRELASCLAIDGRIWSNRCPTLGKQSVCEGQTFFVDMHSLACSLFNTDNSFQTDRIIDCMDTVEGSYLPRHNISDLMHGRLKLVLDQQATAKWLLWTAHGDHASKLVPSFKIWFNQGFHNAPVAIWSLDNWSRNSNAQACTMRCRT